MTLQQQNQSVVSTGFSKSAKITVVLTILIFVALVNGADFSSIIILALFFALYFLPTLIAFNRATLHPSRWLVFLMNLIFGATLFGWLFALVVAVMDLDTNVRGSWFDQGMKNLFVKADETMKQCPHCAETIKAEATICHFCGRDV